MTVVRLAFQRALTTSSLEILLRDIRRGIFVDINNFSKSRFFDRSDTKSKGL